MDIREHSPHSSDNGPLSAQKFQWKKGVSQEGVKQNNHSDTLKMDEEKCILEPYFIDIQNVCVAFYENEDVVIRVRERNGDKE